MSGTRERSSRYHGGLRYKAGIIFLLFLYADFQENDTFQGKFSILYLKNIQEEKLMITGNMILIENKKIYMSIPFCGDMEPEANGKFAYYLLQHLDSKGELKNAVAKLDSLKYNYAKRGFNTRILEELDELDFARQYNSIFGSKYLYIKNADTKNHVIVDADGKEHDIAPDEIQVWYTGRLVCTDVSKLTLSKSETAAVRL